MNKCALWLFDSFEFSLLQGLAGIRNVLSSYHRLRLIEVFIKKRDHRSRRWRNSFLRMRWWHHSDIDSIDDSNICIKNSRAWIRKKVFFFRFAKRRISYLIRNCVFMTMRFSCHEKKKLPKNTVQMYFHSQKDYLEFIEKNDEPYLTIVFVQKEIKNKSVYTVTALTYDLFILKIENLWPLQTKGDAFNVLLWI